MKTTFDISALPASLPVIVTGATGGIGTEITRRLLSLGLPLILPCRNESKFNELRRQMLKEYPDATIEYIPLDLNRADSVAEAAQALDSRMLAGIVNNAGIMCRHFSVNADGRETTLNVNYFNTKLLNELLLPRVAPGGCIVFTTSVTRKTGSHNNLPTSVTEDTFCQLGTYALSKKLITRFAAAFAETAAAKSVRVNCCDPGVVNSGMITMHRWYDCLADIFFRPFIRTASTGAIPAVRALLSNESGRIFTLRNSHPLT